MKALHYSSKASIKPSQGWGGELLGGMTLQLCTNSAGKQNQQLLSVTDTKATIG